MLVFFIQAKVMVWAFRLDGTITGPEANVTIKADLEIPTLSCDRKIPNRMKIFQSNARRSKAETVKKGATLKLGS